MKAAVLYFSLTGNTRKVAEVLGKAGADLYEVEADNKLYAFLGFVKAPVFDASEYDLIVLGCPVWARMPARPLTQAIKKMDFKGRPVNAFVTHMDDEGKSTEKVLKAAGKKGAVQGKSASFKMDKELDEDVVRELLSS